MSTLQRMRAKRARELQTELQSLAAFRRSSRAHVAAIAKAWKPLSRRLARAFERLNATLPEELQLDHSVATPADLVAALSEALLPTWETTEALGALRQLGPRLAKIQPAKVRARAARTAAERAELATLQRPLLREQHVYEQMAADLADETRFQNRLHNANISQKLDGKRLYTDDSYRVQLARWLREYDAKRRAAGPTELFT